MRGRNRLDNRRVGQHAGLRGIRADVGHDRFDLRRHEVRRQRLECRDAERVLRGDRRDGAVP